MIRLSVICFVVLGVAAAVTLSACGSRGIQVSSDDPNYRGAELFVERCSGCHTLDAAGAEGSSGGEPTDGPDLDLRRETEDSVLYAIYNGGFGGNIMPANVLVGDEAKQVAKFVAKYSGKKVKTQPGEKGSRRNK